MGVDDRQIIVFVLVFVVVDDMPQRRVHRRRGVYAGARMERHYFSISPADHSSHSYIIPTLRGPPSPSLDPGHSLRVEPIIGIGDSTLPPTICHVWSGLGLVVSRAGRRP